MPRFAVLAARLVGLMLITPLLLTAQQREPRRFVPDTLHAPGLPSVGHQYRTSAAGMGIGALLGASIMAVGAELADARHPSDQVFAGAFLGTVLGSVVGVHVDAARHGRWSVPIMSTVLVSSTLLVGAAFAYVGVLPALPAALVAMPLAATVGYRMIEGPRATASPSR